MTLVLEIGIDRILIASGCLAVHLVTKDRRRPGRIANVSPHLIPLLRNSGSANPAEFDQESAAAEPAILAGDERDDMAAARGIAVASVLGLAMWIGIVLGVKRLSGL